MVQSRGVANYGGEKNKSFCYDYAPWSRCCLANLNAQYKQKIDQ